MSMKEFLKENERYWADRAEGYCQVNIGELKSDKKLEWIDIIKSNAPVFAGDRRLKVLDIGCGPGFFSIILASAHYKALEYLRKGNQSNIFNLGNGNGYSVKEVIDVARKVTNHDIPAKLEERRSGDPAVLIASSDKAKEVLGWKPEYDSLERIIEDAWRWHKNNVNGYKKLMPNL